MAIGTKNYYLNTSTTIHRSMQDWNDLGYSLDIPSNPVFNTPWQEGRPDIWGYENVMITNSNPEFFAPGNEVRSVGGIPEINLLDPRYQFSRNDSMYRM